MERINEMEVIFDAHSENEGLARMIVAAFLAPVNPTVEEISDVKTAVSEAVTNCIVHGYEEKQGKIWMRCRLTELALEIEIADKGKGIADIEEAMKPFYTTKPEQARAGMGFAFMEAFMDELSVESAPEKGTVVFMKKKWNHVGEERSDA
ncbi:MAG: anti-sigma F factor [Lachnospiraceae bacterium]